MVKLQCKQTSGNRFEVDVDLEGTVQSLKSALSEPSGIAPEQQRVIYKGQILKDAQSLSSYGLQEGHTVHLVRAPSQAGNRQQEQGQGQGHQEQEGARQQQAGQGAQRGGGLESVLNQAMPAGQGAQGGGTDMFQELANHPEIQNAMERMIENPEIARSMIEANPQLRQLAEQNPELWHALNDPSTLRQMFQMARNPELMREQMRTADRAMSNLETHPEGYNMLRRMYETLQEPTMNDPTGGTGSHGTSDRVGSQSQGQQDTSSPSPNASPLPNPWARGNEGGQQQGQGLGALPGMPGGQGIGQSLQQFNQMMEEPGMREFVQSMLSDPSVVQRMVDSNPQLRQMAEQNPQIGEAMRNPEMLRAATDPNTIQALTQMHQAMEQLSNSGLMPSLGGEGQGGQGLLGALQGSGAFPGAGAQQAQQQDQRPPEERFATQLQQLHEMGFLDDAENIRALQATFGNVHAAVERLLQGQ